MSDELYDTLGVDKNASQDEIKKAYRKKAAETHPDKADGDESAFIAVKSAYDVLSNPDAKKHYDATGEAPTPDNDMSNAVSIVAEVIRGTIVDYSFDVESMDLIAVALKAIKGIEQKKVGDIEYQKNKIERNLKKLEKARKRLSKKTSQNFLFIAIEGEIKAMNDAIDSMNRSIEHDRRVFSMARDIVEAYEYEFEEVDQERVALDQWIRTGTTGSSFWSSVST